MSATASHRITKKQTANKQRLVPAHAFFSPFGPNLRAEKKLVKESKVPLQSAT